uniref:DUF2490 domain-containing protein n=1 Tax=Roseihalotalea indica TaxID=2867963 RepID=A0AA49GHK0_9BACT|nr:hypothetical protein K4G66_20675 [Tunicatimonas sp. TK19036]
MFLAFIRVLALLLISQSAFAQIFIGRNFFPAPLDDTTSERSFLPNIAFSAEGMHGFGSAEGEQAWNAKYVGLVELYRFSDKATIAGTLSHELTANPHNEISFHMRGAIWNESLAFFRKTSVGTLEIGMMHHCRHEIDNTVPNDESIDDADYSPTRRLLVMTALYSALSTPYRQINQQMEYRLYGRLNAYTYRVDARRPEYLEKEQSWQHLRASVLLGGRYNFHWSDVIATYARAWVNPSFFDKGEAWKFNYRAEAGLSIRGEKGVLDVFGAYEQYFDDASRPYPLQSNVFFVGARGRSHLFF